MSTAPSDESRFRGALRERVAKEVPMNGIGGVQFSSTTPCIGTDQLGSCSVVLIVSPYAAILGHVSPRPDGSNPNNATGDDHVESFMTRITDFYRQSQSLFSANSSSWVVCAIYQGKIALESQQKIMEDRLSGIGLTVDKSQTYPVPSPDDHLDRGSVFVDGRGNTIRVYVEDRLVRSLPRVQPSQTTAVTSAAIPSSSYTTAYSGSYAATPSAYPTAYPSASSNSAEVPWWQWNGNTQRYEYGTRAGGVQRYQTTRPANVWVYSLSPWQGDLHYAYWDGTTIQYSK